MEIVLVMKLDKETAFRKSLQLGVSSAIMIIIGDSLLNRRWAFWGCALIPFVYIVYELTVGLKSALDQEENAEIKSKIWWSQRMTIVSWLTYPVVYIIPMLGAKGSDAVVGIQVGYC